MAVGNEILFGRIAVHNGIITLEQFEECLQFQRERAGEQHIGQILVERGLLNEAQARAILATQRRNLHRERPGREGEEYKLAQRFVSQGKVTLGELEDIRGVQEEMGSRGLFPSLSDILVQRGKISLSDLSEAQRQVGRKALWCGACGKKYRAVGWRPDRDVFCRKCGGKLLPHERTETERAERAFETSLFAAEDVSFAVFPKEGPPGGEVQPGAGIARERGAGLSGAPGVTSAEGEARGETLDVELPSAMLAPPKTLKPGFLPRPGDVLGGCKLEKKIGVGGMGEIYRARHLALDREVAVKILSSRRMRQAHLVERFLSEARAAARLDHPNIVTVHDIDEERGTYFIVMQFVDGKSLRDVLKDTGPFEVRKSLAVVRQTALALHYAHREHMVHRDIKSGNIMLNEAGNVVIVDFGLTKDFTHDTSLTSDGMVVGTVQYMSPEQADGAQVDGRSDLYSLGVTWYEMLTDSLPFKGDTPWAVLIKQQTEPAPDVRKRRPDCPKRVAKAVARLLEKKPAKRFPTGADLAEEVNSIEQELIK